MTFSRPSKSATQTMPPWFVEWIGLSTMVPSSSLIGMGARHDLVSRNATAHPSADGALVILTAISSGNRSRPRSLMPSLRGIGLVLLATLSICPSKSFVASLGLMSSIHLNHTTRDSHIASAQISTTCPWRRLSLSVCQTHHA
jgi:hypothetical protein